MTLRLSTIVAYGVLGFYLVYILGNLVAAQNPLEQVPEVATLIALALVPIAFVVTKPLALAEVQKLLTFYGAYLGILFLASVFFGNPYVPLWQSFGLDFLADTKPFVFAFLLMVFLTKPQLALFFRAFLGIVIVLSLLNALFILHDLISTTNAYGLPLQQRSGFSIPTGFFNHKSKSAQFQLLGFTACLAALRGGLYPRRRLVLIGMAAGLGLSVLVHLSVKEIASAAIILILFTSLKPGRQIGKAAIFAIFAIGLVAAALTFESPIRLAAMNRIDIFLGERGSKTVRTAAYPISAQLATEHFPLGTGASTFMSKGSRDLAYSPYYVSTGISRMQGGSRRDGGYLMDTFWPKILAQSGYFGLFAFLALVIGPVVRALRAMQFEADGEIYAAAAIMICMLIASTAAPVYTDDHLIFPFAIAFAYALKGWPRTNRVAT